MHTPLHHISPVCTRPMLPGPFVVVMSLRVVPPHCDTGYGGITTEPLTGSDASERTATDGGVGYDTSPYCQGRGNRKQHPGIEEFWLYSHDWLPFIIASFD